jgi:nitrate reductase gamma subunit
MTTSVTFAEMLRRLLRAEGQGRAAKTVEIYGWIVLAEGAICMLWPQSVATALGIPALVDQALNYFRLAGVWVAGIGLLYLLSGRLNATGFVFATLLDRPLVLPLLGVMWYFGMVAGTIALAAGLQDLLTCLWTLMVWRQEFGGVDAAPTPR